MLLTHVFATLLLVTTCIAAPGSFVPPGGRKLVPVKNGSQASGTQGVKPREVNAWSNWRNPLQKRQIKCSDGGYCPYTDYCDTVDGVKGCCPIGEICGPYLDGCADASYLLCKNYDFCCPLDSTCGLDSGGDPVCKVTTTTKRTTTTTKKTTTTTPPAGTTTGVSETTTTTTIEIGVTSNVFSSTSAGIGAIPTTTATPEGTNSAANSTSSAPGSTASASAVTSSVNGGATITSRDGYIFSITAVIVALNHLLVIA